MAKEADPGDTHYPTITLNMWFAISSILLVGAVFWMVIDDWNREWKQWQRKFQTMEADRLESLLKSYNEDPKFTTELTQINEQFRAAQATLDSSKGALEAATEALRLAEGAKYEADNAQRVAKGDYDWAKYLVEEHRLKNPGDKMARQGEIDTAFALAQKTKLAFEDADRGVEVAKKKRNEILASRSKAEAALAAATMERDRHARNLELLRPKTLEGKLAKGVRDFPGLDFAAPSLTVNKVVLEDKLFFDLKFPGKKKTRVDMCMTCHVPIDKAGPEYAAASNPLKSHPRLDMYLSSTSPHPMNDFGCTVCHAGSGETLSFVHADHNPRDEKQRKEWEEKYHWHKMHHWEQPMLPLQHTEASCYQCHSGHLDLIKDEAPRLQRGAELVEKAGCYGCHKIQGVWQELPKAGPSLKHIAAKLSPDWAFAWVQKPADFRPSTWMPQIFHLSNATDTTRAKDRIVEREDVAVNAILEYLWSRSEEFAVPPPPVKGDVERGKEAIQLRGCLACHQIDGLNAPNETNEFGPSLAGVGSKLGEAWIYQWVKNPKKYWPDTKMPDLRLSDQDASDIASYLASLKKDGWSAKRPAVDEKLLQEIASEYLGNQVSLSEGERKLKAALAAGNADRREAMLYVGRKFILRQGCFGCHDIPGFEKETPIGTELSDWGSKDLDKLDFGNFLFTHPPRMEKRRDAWAVGKLTDPRVFDQGKIKAPDELLRMPKFRFTEEEVQIVTTFLLGLVKNDIPVQSMPRLSESKKALARGAALVRQNNCAGCHTLQHEKVTLKHPADGIVSVRGALSYDEDAEEYSVKLREVAPSFAERSDNGVSGGEIGQGITFAKDQLVAKGAPEGGGLLDSFYKLAAQGLRLENAKGEPVTRPLSDATAAEPYAPPSLRWEGRRVQADWLYEFLKKPYIVRPHVPVRMPTFEFNDEEASSLAQYFVRLEEQRYPGEFTRRFRQENAMSRAELAQGAKIGRDVQDGLEILERLESGGRVPADVFVRVQAFAKEHDAKGPGSESFAFETAQRLPFEPIAERSEEYFRNRENAVKDYHVKARNLVGDNNSGNCYSCHWQDGKPVVEDPFAWAPDLEKVHQRMRPEWLRRWLLDPSQVIPNTKMPKPGIGPGKSDAIFPGSFEDSVQALVDYLMNYDRVTPDSSAQ